MARAIDVPREQFQHARQFAAAVDLIATNCGPRAKRLLLSGHPRLPAKVVKQIARTHPDRQRFALAQARAGRAPLGPPPAGVAPPFDTLGPGEVLGRLARNAGALDQVADGLRDLPVDRWPGAEELAVLLDHAKTIARRARLMKRIVKDSRARTPGGEVVRCAGGRRTGREGTPFDPRSARRAVAAVAGITAKNFRELPRTFADTPPTDGQRAALLAWFGALEAAALRLAAVIRWRGHDHATGPSGVPGTYVVFFHLARPMQRLRIGALSTFDFPRGVYAYLGSAFGGGGVRATHRSAPDPRHEA